jgi:hypothetical protein
MITAVSNSATLPCKASWGPEGAFEFSGEALRITEHSIEVFLHPSGNRGEAAPQPGDHVDLEISLPVYYRGMCSRYLRTRARVARMKELTGRRRWLCLVFRKVSFRDRPQNGSRRKAVMSNLIM